MRSQPALGCRTILAKVQEACNYMLTGRKIKEGRDRSLAQNHQRRKKHALATITAACRKLEHGVAIKFPRRVDSLLSLCGYAHQADPMPGGQLVGGAGRYRQRHAPRLSAVRILRCRPRRERGARAPRDPGSPAALPPVPSHHRHCRQWAWSPAGDAVPTRA